MTNFAKNRIHDTMATMNVSLPDPMKSWVEARARDGRYSNVSDFVRDLIRKEQQRQNTVEELQHLIDEAMASGEPRDFGVSDFIESRISGKR